MMPFVLLAMGAIFGLIGAMLLATKREVADDFTEAGESSAPVPQWNYSPGAVGCGGLAILAIGVVLFIAGVVSLLFSGLG